MKSYTIGHIEYLNSGIGEVARSYIYFSKSMVVSG
jgi:hypothetical protein